MTRYSNPQPHNQVPNSQGRPAGAGQSLHGGHPEHDQAGWPAPNVPRTGRPNGAGYGDHGYALDPQNGGYHDPYTALRPDEYGYSQATQPAADPYGLAGYTAPQAPAPQAYTPRAPMAPQQQPSYESYAQTGDPYGANGVPNSVGQPGVHAQQSPFGASPAHGFGSPAHGYGGHGASAQPSPSHAASFGSEFGSAQTAAGYGAQPEGAHNPHADQWGAQSLSLDARDYGHGYGTPAHGGQDGHWEQDPYADPALGPATGYQQDQHAQHGSFDQSYAEDDAHYEDEPPRSSWKKVAAVLACTVFVGGVLTFAYSSIMGPDKNEPTPIVKGASGPSKVKPSEPGGKQFAHTDSKIMGRLGDNSAAPEAESDPAGVRKVPVVTVGRDGSIQPPSPVAPEEETRAVVAVPGLTVIDGLGGPSGPSPNRPVAPKAPATQTAAASDATQPVVVSPPPQRETKSANLLANADASSMGAVQQTKAAAAEAPPVVKPKKERVAAVAPPAESGPQPTGAGYVAVLASVPASNNSRIDALKQFADMQQKYGSILQNKTPDVQEANLGARGTYHRLLVGPPGSRDAANSVCTQLKAEGYSGCWVTAY